MKILLLLIPFLFVPFLSFSQNDTDLDGINDDIDFDPYNYFIRQDDNNNGIGDYCDSDYFFTDNNTKTVLEISRINTSGGFSSVLMSFYYDTFDGELSIQFSPNLDGWKIDYTTSQNEWNEVHLNFTSFGNSVLDWVSGINEINTTTEFVQFFNGSFIGESGFNPIGKLSCISVEEMDSDTDGIIDFFDSCPNTPSGESVDSNGCSDSQLNDDDLDGVMNYVDTCPNTPSGETVGANGCSDSQLDIDDELLNNSIKFYPNPVSNFLSIKSEIIPIDKIEIYSILGKKIKEINSDFNYIKTDNFLEGIYIIRIYSEKGITVRKLIKE